MAEFTFRKSDRHRALHAAGDKRPPRAYDVYEGAGMALLGSVHSASEASYRTMPSGVRYGFRGYSRSWWALDPHGTTVLRGALSREQAARALSNRRAGR